MSESLIFLSLNYHEGFGMPPIEAMLSGCVVIGYAGQGGKEYFLPGFTRQIPDGEILDFVKRIEEVLANPKAEEQGLAAAAWAKNQYSLEKEEASIIRAWKLLLRK